MSRRSWETAAALPKGVRAVDVMAGHEPGLLVSVIIPCYNAADTLPSAIDSALRQDLHFESSQQIGRGSVQRLEVLVLDDGSTDDIQSVQERYKDDAVVHFYRNEKRLGVAKTRNRGALLARGQYIAYLDADDIWAGNAFSRRRPKARNQLNKALSKFTDLSILYTFSGCDALSRYTFASFSPFAVLPLCQVPLLEISGFLVKSGSEHNSSICAHRLILQSASLCSLPVTVILVILTIFFT